MRGGEREAACKQGGWEGGPPTRVNKTLALEEEDTLRPGVATRAAFLPLRHQSPTTPAWPASATTPTHQTAVQEGARSRACSCSNHIFARRATPRRQKKKTKAMPLPSLLLLALAVAAAAALHVWRRRHQTPGELECGGVHGCARTRVRWSVCGLPLCVAHMPPRRRDSHSTSPPLPTPQPASARSPPCPARPPTPCGATCASSWPCRPANPASTPSGPASPATTAPSTASACPARLLSS